MFDLEISLTARRAILRLRGVIRQPDITTAVRACLALPFRVKSIELDLRMVTELAEDSRQILMALVRAWRQARRGHVAIFASESTLGFLGEPQSRNDGATPTALPEPTQLEALTAAFL